MAPDKGAEFVSATACKERHIGTRWHFTIVWGAIAVLGGAVIGGGSYAANEAHLARQEVAVRKAEQVAHNKAVLDSLKDIKAELVRLRNEK